MRIAYMKLRAVLHHAQDGVVLCHTRDFWFGSVTFSSVLAAARTIVAWAISGAVVVMVG